MPASSWGVGERASLVDTLYFGTATPDGAVSARAWKDFVDIIVAPRFPQGFTITEATGQWRGAKGDIVREVSHVVTRAHQADAANDAAVRAIADACKHRFRLESVLRTRATACVSS